MLNACVSETSIERIYLEVQRILVLILRSRPDEGSEVYYKPVSPFQDELSKWFPVKLDDTEDIGPVKVQDGCWKWI